MAGSDGRCRSGQRSCQAYPTHVGNLRKVRLVIPIFLLLRDEKIATSRSSKIFIAMQQFTLGTENVELRGITHSFTRWKTLLSIEELDVFFKLFFFYLRKYIALIARMLQSIDFQYFPVQWQAKCHVTDVTLSRPLRKLNGAWNLVNLCEGMKFHVEILIHR